MSQEMFQCLDDADDTLKTAVTTLNRLWKLQDGKLTSFDEVDYVEHWRIVDDTTHESVVVCTVWCDVNFCYCVGSVLPEKVYDEQAAKCRARAGKAHFICYLI